MKVILHGEGKEKTMHLTQTDQFQNKIIVQVKVFSGVHPSNKWESPVAVDRDQIYEFAYHDGTHYHYRLT